MLLKVRCPICDGAFVRTRRRLVYCSDKCATKGQQITSAHNETRRRVKRRDAPVSEKKGRYTKWQKWYHGHRERDPLHFLWRIAKQRARKVGLEFSITVTDLLVDGRVPEFCPVFGVKLRYGGGSRKMHNDSASIDCIDNAIGYVPGNVQVISFRANAIKRDATLEEIQQISAYMQSHQKSH